MRIHLLAFLFLVSCAGHIEHKMKTPVMLSPEAQGGWPRIEMGAGYMSAPLVQVTDSIALNPPDTARTRIIREEKIFLHGGIGILDRLDLVLDPASWASAKFQVVGDPFTTAKKGNFSTSLLLSGWAEEDDDTDNLNVAPVSSYTKKATAWRAGALAGYRIEDWFLLYGGLSHQEHKYSGGFRSSSRAGRYAGKAIANSAHLGLELAINRDFVIRLEDAYSVSKVPAFGARRGQHSLGLLLAGTLGKKAE